MKGRVCTTGCFVEGRQGLLFQIRSEPVSAAKHAGVPIILLIPPLAEELNRSRRFLTLLGQAVAERGGIFIMLDLFGTGDSDGDFVEARWSTWCDDLHDALSRLRQETDADVMLAGLRSGCLVAADVRRQALDTDCRLVYIQPENNGTTVLKRWLRARVTAGRFSGSSTESLAGLLARLEAGETLNLGGYEVHPSLTKALQASAVSNGSARNAGGLEKVDGVIMLSGSKDIAGLSCDVGSEDRLGRPKIHSIPGRPFWQLQEHEPEPLMVARVAEFLVP